MKKSDKSIILMLVGIVMAALTYFLGYTKLVEQTEIMNKDNATMQKEVDYLQDLANNKQQYLDETAAMSAGIEEIKAQFPAQYLEEDNILYIIGVENQYDVTVESLKIGVPSLVEVAMPEQEVAVADAADTADAEATEATEADAATEVAPEEAAAPEIQLYRTELTAGMLTSYNSVKDVIKKINTDKDRKSLDTISVAFDTETGELSGILGISMYSLSGTDAEYKTPAISGVVYGTQDIFNSVQKKKEALANKAAAANAQ